MQWTIKTKLIMFGLMTTMALAVQVMLTFTVSKEAKTLVNEIFVSARTEQSSPQQITVGLLDEARALAATSGQGAMSTGHVAAIEDAIKQMRELLDDVSARVRRSSEKEAALTAARALLELERDATIELPRMMAAQENPDEFARLLDRMGMHADALLSAFFELSPRTASKGNGAVRNLFELMASSENLSVINFIVFLMLVIFVTLLLGRSITQPMVQITEAMNRLAKGEPDVLIDLTRMDEVGQMALALKALKERMAELEAHRR